MTHDAPMRSANADNLAQRRPIKRLEGGPMQGNILNIT
jgi:hypothetical protein